MASQNSSVTEVNINEHGFRGRLGFFLHPVLVDSAYHRLEVK